VQHTVVSITDRTGDLSVDAQELFATVLSDPPCVFVGSGISIWSPSELPSGQDFTTAMFSLLFENVLFPAPEKELLAQIFGTRYSERFSGMPFEHLMECCPVENKATELINFLYDSRCFNKLHKALAKGMREGNIHSIVTTNYDCCFDAALEEENFSFAKVVTNAQARNVLNVQPLPCYFKIHGSVEKGLEDSPMYSLRHEGCFIRINGFF
jgi:SIR2-like domain